eukprot:m.181152 g.181152  ORF g.181152 m.181152 type:complete len:481 (-) comp15175_c0_seq1:75-1517(-)
MSTAGTPARADPDGRPVDRNGFYLSEAQIKAGVDAAGEPLILTRAQMEVHRRRERKWQDMLKNWDSWMPKKRDKVKERCRKGIPNTLRGWAWRCLCGADKLEAASPGRFERLVAESGDPAHKSGKMAEYLEIIERDLDRTFPHNDRFSVKGGEAQQELRRVLQALAMANKELGYCQGMGMIAGTLMMNMPTEQAFWCMVALQDPNLGYIHGVFDSGLREIQVCGQVLRDLMATHLPAIYEKFEKENMEPVLYMVDWFMVCFVKTLPWASVLRVWDMFMFEGMKIIYRVSLAILHLSRKELLKKSNGLGELMMYLKNLPDEILVPDVLMPAALNISIKTKEIARLHTKAKAEYERTHPAKPDDVKKNHVPQVVHKNAPRESPAQAEDTAPPVKQDPAPAEVAAVISDTNDGTATQPNDELPPSPPDESSDADSDVDLDDVISSPEPGADAAEQEERSESNGQSAADIPRSTEVQLIAVREV